MKFTFFVVPCNGMFSYTKFLPSAKKLQARIVIVGSVEVSL